jgi:hypothetical protein
MQYPPNQPVTQQPQQAQESAPYPQQPAPQKKRGKLPLLLGILAAVLILSGVGVSALLSSALNISSAMKNASGDSSSLTLTAAPNPNMELLYERVFVSQKSIHVLDFKDEEQQTHTLSASFSSKTTLDGKVWFSTYTLTYSLDTKQGHLDIKPGDDLIVTKDGKTCHLANIGMVSGYTTSIYPYPHPVWK